jgi:hypothetical protein
MEDNKKPTKETFNFKSKEDWKDAINKAPNESWVKSRTLGGGKSSQYIPIPIQQALADIIFDEFDVVDEKYKQIENEILCTVKISCLPSYPNAEHRIITGTGAKPIAAKSGSLVHKFPQGKIPNSIEYCAPNARTSAIGNALATFGNVFGRNLGRAVSTGFNMSKNKKKDGKEKK